MTTLEATAPSRVHLDDRKANTSLIHVIRSEWTKIWSVRSTMWTLLSLVVVTIGLSTLFAWGATSNLDKMSPKDLATLDPTNAAMGGLLLGQLAIAVLGALVICTEYSTGGIKTTLSAVPNRLRVLLAKGLVFAVIATVVGMITAFAAFYISMIFWDRQGMADHLGDPGVLRAVIGGGLYVLASGMFGFAIGTLLRHSAGAISAVVGLLFLVPLLTGLLPGSWGSTINKYFTSNAGQRITEVVHVPGTLTPWTGYLALTIEWIIPMIVGAYLMKRRDA